MKSLKILLILICCISAVQAQSNDTSAPKKNPIRLDGPTYKGPSPLYIILRKGKKYVLDTLAVKRGVIDVNTIDSLYITKEAAEIKMYGEAARYGVITLVINERVYPKSFTKLKKHLTRLRLPAE